MKGREGRKKLKRRKGMEGFERCRTQKMSKEHE